MKGNAISRFHVGQLVNYDTKGVGNRQGRIMKFYKSGSHGSAKINNGKNTVTRRLQMVGAI
jgi:hypothetical protein